MNKRILTLVLAFVMVFGLAATAFAEVTVEKITNPKVQWLIDKNIVEGRLQDDGKTKVFDLDKTITREEVAKLVILYRGFESLARSLKGTKGIFSDVAIDRWSNGHINVAQTANLVKGYPDGTFKPEGEITYAEVSAILVRLNSKWTAADEKAATWPVSYIKAAEEFGILKDVKVDDANAKAVRERVFEMMYNAFDGKYQSPIANDKLGVVSRVWVDGIQINGDSKEEYKVTRNTVFIGENLNTIYSAKDFYGSLVRISINDDKEITHMVVLGANKLAKELKRWVGIAEGGVIKTTAPAANLSVANNDEIVINGEKIVINDKTRVFVSDTVKSNFYEAKKIEDAIDPKVAAHKEGVYVAYDVQPVTNVKYARVIVLSSGKEAKAKKDLVRVTNNVNSAYKFMAENTKAVETEYDIKDFKANFPYNYGFEKMDVVKLTREGENGVSAVEMKIDYSEASVFEVTSIGDIRYQNDGTVSFAGNKIELKDKNGTTKTYALSLDGTSVFTNGLPVGSHVQIHFENNELVIDIISKVDRALKGYLPDGKQANEKCGFVEKFGLLADKGVTIQIKSEGLSDLYQVGFPEFFKALEIEPNVILDWAKSKGFAIVTSNPTYVEAAKILFSELVDQKSLRDGKIEICYLVKEMGDMDLVFEIRFTPEFKAELAKKLAKVEACQADARQLMGRIEAAAASLPTFVQPSINNAANYDLFYSDANKAKLVEYRSILAAMDVAMKSADQCVINEFRAADLAGLNDYVDSVTKAYGGDLLAIQTAVNAVDTELAKVIRVQNELASVFNKVNAMKFGLVDYAPLPNETNIATAINNKLGTAPATVAVTVNSVVVAVAPTFDVNFTVAYWANAANPVQLAGKWVPTAMSGIINNSL